MESVKPKQFTFVNQKKSIKMKENINTALLVLITLMVGYGTFFKEDSKIVYNQGRGAQANMAQPASTPISQPAQNQNFDQDFTAQTTINNAQDQGNIQSTNPPTSVAFAETNHDFGTIKQDTENTKVFTFKNTGDKPLLIESARGSCGCTVPNYPKQPIPPGQSGEIEVVYSPGKQKGLQTKSVTIIANTEPRTTVLQIKADVEEV